MNNNYENKILDAIQTLVDSAVSNAGYDKTIKAIVSKCTNESKGEYVVRYQDSSMYAYSNDLDAVYRAGTSVYVLVPGNDMTQKKTILGSVDKLGTEYISLSESDAAYQEIGSSIVTPKEGAGVLGISSYREDPTTHEHEDILVLYDRTQASENNKINVDTEGAGIYFQTAKYVEIGGTFITKLTEEQKRKGDYGLVFDISFKNGEEEVHRNYVIDINSMTGNPYSYNYGSAQTAIFEIDGENFYRINKITFLCKNFPQSANPYTSDIFVEDVVLKALTPLTREEIGGNSLTFITKEGIYFNSNDNDDATRLIETEVKINRKVVPNTGGILRYYWFKEDSRIGINSEDYLPYGGPGWKCINAYNIVDEENNVREYIVDKDTLTVAKDKTETEETGVHPEWHNSAKENEYKCVVIYNNDIYVERNIIIYNQDSDYTVTIESDQGNYFKYNEGSPTLTCTVTPSGTYTYIWAVTDSNNRTEVLDETSNSYSVQLGTIANFSKFTCSVFSGNNFRGKSNIVITNSWDKEDNTYSLVMENGDQIFKYNEKGISPTNKSLEKPIVIKPLQFILYDELGHQVDDNKIRVTDVSWYVPKEDTMIIVDEPLITPTEDGDYLVYSTTKTLNLDIAPVYNNKKMNNTVKLVVRYSDRVLTAVSQLEFIKEGEIGSNGTNFVCRIVPNLASGAQMPNYPVYTYNTATSTGAMNYVPAANGKWFKVELYKDGIQIFPTVTSDGTCSGTSAEGKAVAVAWSILKNKYSNTISDTTSFSVNSSTGVFNYTNLSNLNLDRASNTAKVEVTYEDATYYATMPIIVVKTTSADYKLDLDNNTGFRYVMYTTDGLNPVYDSANPFAIKVLQTIGGVDYDISTSTEAGVAVDYTWSMRGSTYDPDYTSPAAGEEQYWRPTGALIEKTHISSNPLARNEKDYRPIEKCDGLATNNAVKCIIKRNNSELARIYLPIHFYLNRFGNAALNGWDGNHVEINENGGFILAPQVGAGKKEQDNSYTGVFMGTVREAGSNVEEVGLYGYHKGTRTIALDTKDGSARFGKQGAGQIIIDPSSADYNGKGTARIYSNDYSPNYVSPGSMVPAQTKYVGGYSYWKESGSNYYLMKSVEMSCVDGYYHNGNFYADSSYTTLITPELNRQYHDLYDKKCYIYKMVSGVNTYEELVNYYKIGDTIAPSVKVWAGGSGLEIDLNDPHIRFGSGKFRIDNDGQVYATGFATVTEIQEGAYVIPSASIDVGGGDTLNDYMTNTESTLEDLQSQIDGNISTWFYAYEPEMTNEPASTWTTTAEKDNHLGDLFYDTTTGYCYRFMKEDNEYQWGKLSDSDITEALAAAAEAQRTADAKAEVFISTGSNRPSPPYNVGDLWIKDNDLYKCKTTWTSGSWNDSHWERATDYTNDSAVNTLKTEVISSSEVQYAVGDDAETAPTTGWSPDTPTWEEGKYIWQRTVVTYADSTQEVPHTDTSDPVCIQGAKGEPGGGGEDAYTIVLSNESHTFAANTTTAIAETIVVTPYVYKGATQIINYDIGTITGQISNKLTASKSSTAPYTISISATNTLDTDGVLTIPIIIDKNLSTEKTFNKQFSWALAKKGDPGSSPTAYSLVVSHAAIVKTKEDSYSPTSVTFYATAQTGSGEIREYTDGSYRITKDGGTPGSWIRITGSNSCNLTNVKPSTSLKIELSKERETSSTHTIVDVQTLPVARDGIDGDDGVTPYIAYLTNETQVFAAKTASNATTNLYAFQGSTEKKVTLKKVGTYTISSSTPTTQDCATGKANLNFRVSSIDAVIHPTITFKATSSINESVSDKVTIEYQIEGENFNRVIDFSYSTTTKGTDARIYEIDLSATQVIKKVDNTFAPTSITANAYYRTGTSATKTSYSGRWLIQYYYYNTSTSTWTWATGYTSPNDESSKTYPIPTNVNEIKLIKVYLGPSGNTPTASNALDIQTIPILNDSTDVEIGGRNFLKYTAYTDFSGVTVREDTTNTIKVSIDNQTVYNGNSSLKIECTEVPSHGTYDIWQYCWSNLAVGTPLRLSLYVKGAANSKAWFTLEGATCSNGTTSGTFDVSDSWQKLDIDLGTVTAAATTGTLVKLVYGFDNFSKPKTFYINSMMLEAGNIATGWVPAPEDSQTINAIQYTTTEHFDASEINENSWSDDLPALSSVENLFIWKKEGIKNSDTGAIDWRDPICIWKPQSTLVTTEYCLCTSDKYSAANIKKDYDTNNNVIKTYDWTDKAYEWKSRNDDINRTLGGYVTPKEGEDFNTLVINTYQFVRNVYKDAYDDSKPVTYSDAVLDMNWLNFGKYSYLSEKSAEVLSNKTNNSIIDITSGDGIYIRNPNNVNQYIHLTSAGINFFNANSTEVTALGIDGTLHTEYIKVNTIKAENVESGKLTLSDTTSSSSGDKVEAAFILNKKGVNSRDVVVVDIKGVSVTNDTGDILTMQSAADKGFTAWAYGSKDNDYYFETSPRDKSAKMQNAQVKETFIFDNAKFIKTTRGFSIIDIH